MIGPFELFLCLLIEHTIIDYYKNQVNKNE